MNATTPHLVYMANQIATAFRTREPEAAVRATFDHIWQFWDPRMRTLIVEHLAAGGDGLGDVAKGAVQLLADRLQGAA